MLGERKTHSPTRTLLVIVFVLLGVATLSALLLYGFPTSPVESVREPIIQPEQATVGLPVRLTIPALGVSVAVEYVGVAADGNMGVPKGPEGVAWFKFGPRPGESGSAVIAGHFGWKDDIPAVFDSLDTLKKGDRIYSEDTQGTETVFIVRESKLYDPKADAKEVFESSDGKAHLNLVTCEGVWDAASKSYSKRLVVFADKE